MVSLKCPKNVIIHCSLIFASQRVIVRDSLKYFSYYFSFILQKWAVLLQKFPLFGKPLFITQIHHTQGIHQLNDTVSKNENLHGKMLG